VRYAATFLVVSGPFPLGVWSNGWAAKNVLGDAAKNGAIAANNFVGSVAATSTL